MKKLLIIITLFVVTQPFYSQANDKWKNFDTLIAGTDTLVNDTASAFHKYLIVSASDTGSTYTDSVFVEVYDPKLTVWARVGVRDLYDFTDDVAIIPGAGNTRMFLVLYPAFSTGSQVRLRKGNVIYVAGNRTLTSLRWVNNF